MNPIWRHRYEAAIVAAHTAGKHALHYFDRSVTVEYKSDRSPVTIADREAEAMLRSSLSATFPDDGFLGEEHGEQPGSSGYRWIIDPIDGTKSYVRSIPLWATLLGLEYRGEMIAGIAYLPALGTTYRAMRGDGACRDDRRIHVSDVSRLDEAMLVYSSVSWFTDGGEGARVPEAGVANAAAARLWRFLRLRAGGAGLGRDHGRARHLTVGRGGDQADRRGSGRANDRLG